MVEEEPDLTAPQKSALFGNVRRNAQIWVVLAALVLLIPMMVYQGIRKKEAALRTNARIQAGSNLATISRKPPWSGFESVAATEVAAGEKSKRIIHQGQVPGTSGSPSRRVLTVSLKASHHRFSVSSRQGQGSLPSENPFFSTRYKRGSVKNRRRDAMIRASKIMALEDISLDNASSPKRSARLLQLPGIALPKTGIRESASKESQTLLDEWRKRQQEPLDRVGRDRAWMALNQQASVPRNVLSPLTVNPALPGYVVSEGSYIRAVLMTRVVSDLPGPMEARVCENVYDSVTGNMLLIPAGSLLIGQYDNEVNAGQVRIMGAFSRLVFPDGSSVNLSGMPAVGNQGASGIQDSVNDHFWKIFGSGFVIAELANLVNRNPPTPVTIIDRGGTMSNAAGQVLVQTAQSLLNRNLSIAPTITIHAGHLFNIAVRRDMLLPPYPAKAEQ